MTSSEIGRRVIKTGGDYRFSGVVVAVFTKKSGVIRYVVENDEGILHIFSAANFKGSPSMTSFDYFTTEDLKSMTVAERFYTTEVLVVARKNGYNIPLDVAFLIAKDVILKQS
jgi:hypothetical protein